MHGLYRALQTPRASRVSYAAFCCSPAGRGAEPADIAGLEDVLMQGAQD